MKKTIVIIFFGDFFYDARCINMANSIIDDGHKLYIIDSGNSASQFRGMQVFHVNVMVNGFYKYVKFFKKTKQLISKIHPTTIIASDLYSLPSACSFKEKNIIYDSREIYSQHAGMINNKMKQFFWHMIEKIFIKKTNVVLVTADGDKVILNKLYNDIKIQILYNFPSIKMKMKKENLLRKKINLLNNEKIFLYQGVLHPGRGIKNMIMLLKEFDDCHGVIIGDGPYKDKILEFAKKYDLLHRIHMLGRVKYTQMMQLTADADIGFSIIKPISQSYEQALPNKLFEYALVKVPVICSDLVEMKQIVNKHKIGISVSYNNMVKQKMVLNELLKNKPKYIKDLKTENLIWENQESKFLQVIY